MQYINQFESQEWSVSDGPYYTPSTWNGVRDHQVAANQGYWAPHPFNHTSNWRNDKDNWCQENWCQSEYGPVAGKENTNSIRCAGAAGCKRGRQRRKPAQGAQCKSQSPPNAKKPCPVAVPAPKPGPAAVESIEPPAPKPGPAVPAPAAEPVPTPPAAVKNSAVENSAPPLLPEHLSLLAPFLSSNADSGSWRATCKDAKEALLPNGPYTAMLSPAGQAALVGLEKRKKLQKILVNARMLVSGFSLNLR